MPETIKSRRLKEPAYSEFFEKVLSGELTYKAILKWLKSQHNISISTTTVSRLGKAINDKYAPLIKLGMPIKTIVEQRYQIEALGVEQVKQQLIKKLTENGASLFAYLTEKGGGQ
jgi:hypothetical protein